MNPLHLPRRLIWLLALSSWLLALPAAAATREYDAEAAAVPQVDSVLIGGTWAAAETLSVKIGNATLTVTTGSDTTATATVASVLKNAINATSIDNNLVGAETRNAAGQLLGEFRDIEAIIDPGNTSKVLIRSKVAGVPFYDVSDVVAPFTLAASEGSAAGTVTVASVQAATGPWHWDNATNWSANTLPVNDDTVVFKVKWGPKYGLPNGSLEVTYNTYQSLTDMIGLPLWNANGYGEYRQPYVKLDESGTGTAITHLFGLGDGAGPSLVNLWHATSTLTVSATVFGTGTSTAADKKALNLVIDNGAGAGGTVTINKGSVDIGENFGAQPNFAALNIGYRTNPVADSDVVTKNHNANLSVTQTGGTLTFIETINPTGSRIFTLYGGALVARDIQTSGSVTATILGGTMTWDSAKTIATLIVSGAGVVDAEHDSRAFTVTNCDLFKGASLLDRFGRGTYTNGVDLNRCGSDDVTLRFGNHKRVTLGSVP